MTADDVTIKGLVVNRCTSWDIQTNGDHQHLVVEGCFIGTNADGTQALSPYLGGVFVQGHQNARIGGTTPAARNLISGLNGGNHVYLANFSPALTTGTLVAGNLIGTDITGHLKISTTSGGVGIQSGTDNVIGGPSAAARNVIAGVITIGLNGGTGASGNLVQGNYVGTDVTGTAVLGCAQECVRLLDQNNTIGGCGRGRRKPDRRSREQCRDHGPGLRQRHPGQRHRDGRDGDDAARERLYGIRVAAPARIRQRGRSAASLPGEGQRHRLQRQTRRPSR